MNWLHGSVNSKRWWRTDAAEFLWISEKKEKKKKRKLSKARSSVKWLLLCLTPQTAVWIIAVPAAALWYFGVRNMLGWRLGVFVCYGRTVPWKNIIFNNYLSTLWLLHYIRPESSKKVKITLDDLKTYIFRKMVIVLSDHN